MTWLSWRRACSRAGGHPWIGRSSSSTRGRHIALRGSWRWRRRWRRCQWQSGCRRCRCRRYRNPWRYRNQWRYRWPVSLGQSVWKNSCTSMHRRPRHRRQQHLRHWHRLHRHRRHQRRHGHKPYRLQPREAPMKGPPRDCPEIAPRLPREAAMKGPRGKRARPRRPSIRRALALRQPALRPLPLVLALVRLPPSLRRYALLCQQTIPANRRRGVSQRPRES